MAWAGWLNRERLRWVGVGALALTASALIAGSGSFSVASAQAAPTSGAAGNAPRTDTATANGRRFFSGSVAPAVRAPAFVPAPAATVATGRSTSPRTVRSSRAAGPRDAAGSARVAEGAEQTAADDVWSIVSSGRSASIMPVAGDGAAVSSSNVSTNLTLGVLLLGAGALTLLGGLAAAALHGRVYVG